MVRMNEGGPRYRPEKDIPAEPDRFIANLHDFKKYVLSLDFFQDVVDDQLLEKEMTPVPENFADERHYLDVMTPLFWEEAKMQLERSKKLEMPPDTEVLHLIKFRMEQPWIRIDFGRTQDAAAEKLYSQGDILLVTRKKDPHEEEAAHFLALVDRSMGLKMDVTAISGDSPRFLKVARLISDKATWYAAKVMSTQTLVREFEGLYSLPKLPLRDLIINREEPQAALDTSTEMQAAPAPMGMKSDKGDADEAKMFSIPEKLEAQLKATHNESQMQAIKDSRKVFGITLVQGPPGTGKTKTVLGILAVLLNAQARESTSVSYTRTGRKRGQGEAERDDDTSSDEDPAKKRRRLQEEEKRRQERLEKIRRRTPWLCGGFNDPRSQISELEVPGPGDRELNNPYPKLPESSLVPMSELSRAVGVSKVLVCTPSNAAVDEVLRRVAAEGVLDAEGKPRKRPIVRLGPNSHSSLEQYCLEQIVRRNLLSKTEAIDLHRQEVEKEKVMREASVLFSTLSTSGSREMVGFPGDFDTVVMDEASQGLEVSTLVPLKLGCRRLIMVGDPKQLPATCFSAVSRKHGFERSFFQRLHESNYKVNMLQIQYRMHPSISYFPSHRFYDSKLLNALDEEAFEKMRPTKWSHIPCFGPIAFFQIRGEQKVSLSSFVNEEEADFVIRLYTMLAAIHPSEDWRNKLAVISPYKEQVKKIREKFKALYGLKRKDHCPVDVNTVDGFQGREKDAIIVSTVRADPEASIGFVKDQRRMNVAFTRARSNLWVVGHAQILGAKNKDWKAFIKRQQANTRFLRTSRPYNTWLKRYLREWYDRHPDEDRPSEKILGNPDDEEEMEEELPAGDFTISREELEELEREEREQAKYLRPDIEEVSDDEESLEGDGDSNDGAMVQEEVATRRSAGAAGDGDGGG